MRELLLHSPERIELLYLVLESKSARELASAVPLSMAMREVGREELDALTDGGVHQGVAALVRPAPDVKLKDILQAESRPPLVALDEVTDPHNLGAVLRACEATGVAGVIVPGRRSALLTAAARKASAGASELVPLIEVTNLVQALKEARAAGYWIIGTALGEGAQDIYDAAMPLPAVVVFGSEGRGLRPLVRATCDVLLQIPMQGKLQSINISQAAAVVLFELRRQMRRAARN